MIKRIEKKKKKKTVLKKKEKLFNVNINMSNMKLINFNCLVCNSQSTFKALDILTTNTEYSIQICLMCHPVITKKQSIITSEGRLSNFMNRYNQLQNKDINNKI
jgi:ribosomal protein L31